MQMLSLLPEDASLHSIWTAHASMVHYWTFMSSSFKEIPEGEVVPEIIPWFKKDVTPEGETVYCEKIDFNGVLEEQRLATVPDMYVYKPIYQTLPPNIEFEPVVVTFEPKADNGCNHVWKAYSVPFSNPVNYCRHCGVKEKQ